MSIYPTQYQHQLGDAYTENVKVWRQVVICSARELVAQNIVENPPTSNGDNADNGGKGGKLDAMEKRYFKSNTVNQPYCVITAWDIFERASQSLGIPNCFPHANNSLSQSIPEKPPGSKHVAGTSVWGNAWRTLHWFKQNNFPTTPGISATNISGIPDLIFYVGLPFYRSSTSTRASGHFGVLIDVDIKLKTFLTVEGNSEDDGKITYYTYNETAYRKLLSDTNWEFINLDNCVPVDKILVPPSWCVVEKDCQPLYTALAEKAMALYLNTDCREQTSRIGRSPQNDWCEAWKLDKTLTQDIWYSRLKCTPRDSQGGGSDTYTETIIPPIPPSPRKPCNVEQSAVKCNWTLYVPGQDLAMHWSNIQRPEVACDIAGAEGIVGGNSVPFGLRNGAAVNKLSENPLNDGYSGLGCFTDRNNNLIYVITEEKVNGVSRRDILKSNNILGKSCIYYELPRAVGDFNGHRRAERQATVLSGRASLGEFSRNNTFVWTNDTLRIGVTDDQTILDLFKKIEDSGIHYKDPIVLDFSESQVITGDSVAQFVVNTLSNFTGFIPKEYASTTGEILKIGNSIRTFLNPGSNISSIANGIKDIASIFTPNEYRAYLENATKLYVGIQSGEGGRILNATYNLGTNLIKDLNLSSALNNFGGSAVESIQRACKEVSTFGINALNDFQVAVLNQSISKLKDQSNASAYSRDRFLTEYGGIVANDPVLGSIFANGSAGAVLPSIPGLNGLLYHFQESREFVKGDQKGDNATKMALSYIGLGIPLNPVSFDVIALDYFKNQALSVAERGLTEFFLPLTIGLEKANCIKSLLQDCVPNIVIRTTPSDGSSNPPTNSCKTNEVWDGAKMKCVCLPGYIMVGGKCIKDSASSQNSQSNPPGGIIGSAKECPSGTYYDKVQGKCVELVGGLPTCPLNMYYEVSLNKCICLAGYVMFGGKCIEDPNKSKLPGGDYYTDPTDPSKCPETMIGTPPDCRCPDGQVWNESMKRCFDQIVQCPDGQVWDKLTQKCEPIKCPDGYVWNQTIRSCVLKDKCPDIMVGTPPNCSCPEGFAWSLIELKCLRIVKDEVLKDKPDTGGSTGNPDYNYPNTGGSTGNPNYYPNTGGSTGILTKCPAGWTGIYPNCLPPKLDPPTTDLPEIKPYDDSTWAMKFKKYQEERQTNERNLLTEIQKLREEILSLEKQKTGANCDVLEAELRKYRANKQIEDLELLKKQLERNDRERESKNCHREPLVVNMGQTPCYLNNCCPDSTTPWWVKMPPPPWMSNITNSYNEDCEDC